MRLGIVAVAIAVVSGVFGCFGERERQLEVALSELARPESVPLFPLAAFSPEGYLALTFEETVAYAPYVGHGGFQVYLPYADGMPLVPGPRIDLQGEDWARTAAENIGGMTLLWTDDGLILGPDLASSVGLAISTRRRLHVSHKGEFAVGGRKFKMLQLPLPRKVALGGSVITKGERLFVYDVLGDWIVVFEDEELIQRSEVLQLRSLIDTHGMSIFHSGEPDDDPATGRNLWLPGFRTDGRLIGVSRADGEVLIFDEKDLSFERLGSASRNEPVWQPGFAEDTLVVASDAFDRGRNIVGVRLERWRFKDEGVAKQASVLEGLEHATLLPFGVALRDSHHGVLFGVGSNGILQWFEVRE